MKTPIYGAIPVSGGWTVKRGSQTDQSRWHPTDCRAFGTFEEADQCAKEIAAGRYGYQKGLYVNMR